MNGADWLRIGAVSGFLGVGAGAFGAHGLEKVLDVSMLTVFETAARYQMYHAFALVGVGVLGLIGPRSRALTVAGWGFLVGSLLFSGSLYALALTGIRGLGAITPFGGVGFLVGWAVLACHRPEKRPET